jgi:Uncharacterized protein conserved in bacteria
LSADRCFGVSAENGLALYLCLEKTGQAGQAGSAGSGSSDFPDCFNVLTTNTKYHLLIEQIQTHQPDLVLTLETDQAWQDALAVIEPDYPYRVPYLWIICMACICTANLS